MEKVIFRKATKADIQRIAEIYDDFLDYEAEHEVLSNWLKGVYPTADTAERALAVDTLYVGELDNKIVGSYIINHVQPEEYAKFHWEYQGEGDEVIVIHTMCLDVAYQGHGLGTQFVNYAIELGRSMGCKTLRLDTAETNTHAARLYEKYGFRYAGVTEFFFEQFIVENLIGFEYKL